MRKTAQSAQSAQSAVEPSVAEYLANRQPFTPLPQCPACGSAIDCGLQFRLHKAHRGTDGALDMDIVTLSMKPDPHHVVTCGTCYFQWEMEVKDPC